MAGRQAVRPALASRRAVPDCRKPQAHSHFRRAAAPDGRLEYRPPHRAGARRTRLHLLRVGEAARRGSYRPLEPRRLQCLCQSHDRLPALQSVEGLEDAGGMAGGARPFSGRGIPMTVVSVDLAYSDYRDFGMIALDDGPSGATSPPLSTLHVQT